VSSSFLVKGDQACEGPSYVCRVTPALPQRKNDTDQRGFRRFRKPLSLLTQSLQINSRWEFRISKNPLKKEGEGGKGSSLEEVRKNADKFIQPRFLKAKKLLFFENISGR
jgi:hypothetical protein